MARKRIRIVGEFVGVNNIAMPRGYPDRTVRHGVEDDLVELLDMLAVRTEAGGDSGTICPEDIPWGGSLLGRAQVGRD